MKYFSALIGFIAIINACLGQSEGALRGSDAGYSFPIKHLINPSSRLISQNQPGTDLIRSRVYGDDIQRLDSTIVFSLPDNVPEEINVIQYFLDEQTIIRTKYSIDDHDNRVPDRKSVILLNPDKTFHMEYECRWNDTSQKWDTININQYYYNESGLYLTTSSYISEDQHYYYKTEYTYNEDNMLVLETLYQQRADETWYPANKTFYSYSDKRLVDEHIFYVNHLDEDWYPLSKHSYTYDTYGNINEVLYWTEEYYPDGELHADFKYIYRYDLSVSSDNVLLPTLDFRSNNKLTEIIAARYEKDHDEWIAQASITLYYSPDIITSTTDLNAESAFHVYPNPFDEHINIVSVSDEAANGTLDIYDQLGNNVLRTNILGSQKISTEGLTPGIYHCILNDGNQTIIERLIKNN